MAHKVLDPNLVGRVRRSPGRYDADLKEIGDDNEFWGHFRELDRFKVTLDANGKPTSKAAASRQSLVNQYGTEPAIAGYTFKTVRSLDGQTDFLAVMFDEDKIVSGAWEAFEAEKADKAAEKAAVMKAKKLKAQVEAKALASRLNADYADEDEEDDLEVLMSTDYEDDVE